MNEKKAHPLKLDYQSYKANKKFLQNSIIQKYLISKYLTSGNFGSVYKGMNIQTKKQVAIKILDLKEVQNEINQKVKKIKERLVRSQSQLMMKLNSPYLVKCYDVYENENLKLMIIEYCNGGTLQEEIKNKVINEKQALFKLKHLINGLVEMHQHKIIHRDLKAQNILKHNGYYKIADLGFSKQIEEDSQLQRSVLGTVSTMAPEVACRKPYGLKADIWSLGVILYRMLSGEMPYQSKNVKALKVEIQSKKLFFGDRLHTNVRISPKIMDFLKGLMQLKSQSRLNWEQLISHKVFSLMNELPPYFTIIPKLPQPPQDIQESDSYFTVFEEIGEPKPNNLDQHSIEKLSPEYIENQISTINKQEQQNYNWSRLIHLQCLKTEFIFLKLVTPLQKNQKFLKNSRQKMQMIYLLLTRCLMNMNPIKRRIQQHLNCQVLLALQDTVKKLYEQVSHKWLTYGKLLTAKEDEIISIVSDRVSKIFDKESFEQKDKFIAKGFERIQYTRDQQIQYTYKNYIKSIKEQIKPKSRQIFCYLSNYPQICKVTFQSLKKSKFEDFVQKFVI